MKKIMFGLAVVLVIMTVSVGCTNTPTGGFSNLKLVLDEGGRDLKIKGDNWDIKAVEQIIIQAVDVTGTASSYCSLGNEAKVDGVKAWTAVYNSTEHECAWDLLPKNIAFSQGKWAVRVLLKTIAEDLNDGDTVAEITDALMPCMAYGNFGWTRYDNNDSANNNPAGAFLNPGTTSVITLSKATPDDDMEVDLKVDVTSAMSFNSEDLVLRVTIDHDEDSTVLIQGTDNSAQAPNTVRFLSEANQKIVVPGDSLGSIGRHILMVDICRNVGDNDLISDRSVMMYFNAYEGMTLDITGEFSEGKFVRFSFDTYVIEVGDLQLAYLSKEDNPLQYQPLYIDPEDDSDFVPSLSVYTDGITVTRVSDGNWLHHFDAEGDVGPDSWVFVSPDGLHAQPVSYMSIYADGDVAPIIDYNWATNYSMINSEDVIFGSGSSYGDLEEFIFYDNSGNKLFEPGEKDFNGSIYTFKPIAYWDVYYDESAEVDNPNLNYANMSYKDGGNFKVSCTAMVMLPDAGSTSDDLHLTVYEVRTSKNFTLEQMSSVPDNVVQGRRYRLTESN